MKWNILRRLSAHGCDVRVYPATTPASELLATKPGRRVPQQRPRRSGAADLRDRQREDARRRRTCRCSASASATRSSAWRWAATTFKLKFGHRGANHPVKKLDDRQDRDHVAEPRLRGRSGVAAGRRRGDAPEPVRRHRRRAAAHDAAGVLRAVSSRGVARAARRGLPVRRFHQADRGDRAEAQGSSRPKPPASSLQPQTDATTNRPQTRPRHRLRTDRHRPGVRVRLLRHRRRARRCAPKGSRSSWSTAIRRRS